ncbi:hypothetical protein NLU13_2949 [Sarocladium strictum]|uniref:Uncharacterized protein n=1 Tax=Sarocladium strictum TaxID=5046 RepID=A0AA39L9Z7_SARSR|nr:hypothetical protein NLU13_2949 [Sarocladium strictum]
MHRFWPRQQLPLRPRCSVCRSQQRWVHEPERRQLSDDRDFKASLSNWRQRTSTPLGTFIRHEEPDGQIWYTVKPKIDRLKRENTPNFYEIPDALIDLDADGQSGVRVFSDEDERKMAERWSVNSTHEAAASVIYTMETEATRLRHSWEEILAQPASPWRISHHDVVSVALRGVADSSDQAEPQRLVPGGRAEFIRSLCQSNGIPAYAAQDDKGTLEWMLIRKSAMEHHATTHTDQLPTVQDFTEAVKGANSFMELSRVIATCSQGSLGNEHNAIATFDGSVPDLIQHAVMRLLNDYETGSPQREEALRHAVSVVVSSEMNLRSCRPDLGVKLWAFGHQLAKSHSLLLMIDSLRKGLEADYTAISAETKSCLIDSVTDLLVRLATSERDLQFSGLTATALLRLLTGAPSTERTGSRSIRSIIMDKTPSDMTPDAKYRMYASYVALLGRLGAVRSLWAEYRAVGTVAKEIRLYYHPSALAHAIVSAVAASPPFRGKQVPDSKETSSLLFCFSADYRDLASRTGCDDSRAAPSSLMGLDTLEVEAALRQSLSRYLGELTRLQRVGSM